MKVLDLFSCIGCHALGMHRAGHETIAMCENNPWRRAHLARRFPGIPIFEDVHDIDPPAADVCFGGPPCQQTSVAAAIHGRRSGATLWPAMFRAGLRAYVDWFVVEQPPGNTTWETKVASDLCRSDYSVAMFEFGAHDVGAPYIRRRRYILACTRRSRLALARDAMASAIDRVARSAASRGDWNPDTLPAFGMDDWRSEGVADRRQRIEALGDSNPPQMAEVIGLALQAAS